MPPYLLYNYAPKNSVGNREIIDFMVINSLSFVEHFLGQIEHPMYSLLKETFSNKHQKIWKIRNYQNLRAWIS